MPLKKGNQQIAITISDNVDWIYLTKHEYQQSQHNYQLDQSEGFEILSPDSYHIALLAQTETIHLKKGRYDISCGWPDLDSAYFGKDNI